MVSPFLEGPRASGETDPAFPSSKWAWSAEGGEVQSGTGGPTVMRGAPPAEYGNTFEEVGNSFMDAHKYLKYGYTYQFFYRSSKDDTRGHTGGQLRWLAYGGSGSGNSSWSMWLNNGTNMKQDPDQNNISPDQRTTITILRPGERAQTARLRAAKYPIMGYVKAGDQVILRADQSASWRYTKQDMGLGDYPAIDNWGPILYFGAYGLDDQSIPLPASPQTNKQKRIWDQGGCGTAGCDGRSINIIGTPAQVFETAYPPYMPLAPSINWCEEDPGLCRGAVCKGDPTVKFATDNPARDKCLLDQKCAYMYNTEGVCDGASQCGWQPGYIPVQEDCDEDDEPVGAHCEYGWLECVSGYCNSVETGIKCCNPTDPWCPSGTTSTQPCRCGPAPTTSKNIKWSCNNGTCSQDHKGTFSTKGNCQRSWRH